METKLKEEQGVRIAVEGCGHGTLHAIYASVERSCAIKGWPGVDLLIIGGDFQSVRNAADLAAVSMPAKYRAMHDFHDYYSGARTAPYLTVFVGGNHEASNYLFELYYGGWVAPNIYYMGAANVLRLGPLRIAGMSGIWKGFDYKKGHHERLPYNNDDIRSIYHVREIDVRKLLQLRTQVDIGISHDWPRAVEWKGDHARLFRQKAHLEEDARNSQLGSVAAKYVMDRLRPRQWFSAHLHCKYAAVVDHKKSEENQQTAEKKQEAKNDAEIDLDVDGKQTKTNGNTNGNAIQNSDEIDLDMDDTESTKNSAVPPVVAANADEIDLELEDDAGPASTAQIAPGQGLDGVKVSLEEPFLPAATSAVPEDLRAQLPAAFSRPKPEPRAPVQPPMSHPPGITNTTTHFLALDKCLPNRDFLQLLTIQPNIENSNDNANAPATSTSKLERPLKLTYDPEFLAITRALSLEHPLILGDPSHRPSPDAGELHYLPLIEAQESWVKEHITDLTIPENFSLTAPLYDESMGLNAPEGPREYSNPQTVAFCTMLELPNPFALSDEEREARIARGPRADEERSDRGGRGGFPGRGGRGRGRGFGGGRGGGRGERFGGRGRGRGGFGP